MEERIRKGKMEKLYGGMENYKEGMDKEEESGELEWRT